MSEQTSDTPLTNALSTFLVVQFPATLGSVQLNQHLIGFERIERELNAALSAIDLGQINCDAEYSKLLKENASLQAQMHAKAQFDEALILSYQRKIKALENEIARLNNQTVKL